jgi:RecB family exonuclease
MATLNELRNREHHSFSSINQFINICSLQYFFDRIVKLPKSWTPVSLAFGSAYHRTLEWAAMIRMEGHMPNAIDAEERFRDAWDRQLKDDDNVRLDREKSPDEYGDEGAKLVSAYLESVDPSEEVVSISEAFAVPLIDVFGNALEKPLVGEFDCRVRLDGQDVIVDWKTSGRRWPKEQADKSLQPAAYVYAAKVLTGKIMPMRFDVVVKNKAAVVEQHTTHRCDDDSDRMVELVKQIESMVAAEHFLPSEQSFYCGGCPHQAACKSWHRDRARVTVPMAA